jgi:hypothetical protein
MTKKKTKALREASTKNKIIKPVKALTGLEIALIGGAAGLVGSQMGKQQKAFSSVDPFKQIDPLMAPSQFIARQTSAPTMTLEALDPITSADESAEKSISNETEDTEKMKKGGIVRGAGKAIRGTKFKGVF